VLPPQINFIRKATACQHSFIPICDDSFAVGMVNFMKKCVHCGRLGLFFPLDGDGLCAKCAEKEKKRKEEAELSSARNFVRKISDAFEEIEKNGARFPTSVIRSWIDTQDVPYDCVQRLREDCQLICDELPKWEEYPRFEDAVLEKAIPDKNIREYYEHPFIPLGVLHEKDWVIPNDFAKKIPELLKKVKALDSTLLLYGKYEYKTYRIVGASFDNDDGSSRQAILGKIKRRAKPFQTKPKIRLEKYLFQGKEDAVAVYADDLCVGHISRSDLSTSLLKAWDRFDSIVDFEIIGKSSGYYGMEIEVRFIKEH